MAVVVLGICAVIGVRTIHLGTRAAPAPSVISTTPHTASLAADGRSHATLRVVTGTPDLTISMANLGAGGALVSVTTPAASSPPVLRTAGAGTADPVISLSTKRASAFTVTLNSAVSWQLDLASGTTRTTADLRGGQVTGITITKGSDILDLTLPSPHGSVPVKLAAGVSQLLLSLPSGVPARVSAGAGAAHVSLDGVTHADVRKGTVFTSPAWKAGADGFDVEATAGAARITVTAQAG